MRKKEFTLSSWLLTLVFFQVALSGLLLDDKTGEAWSAMQIATIVGQQTMKVGKHFPELTAYNTSGSTSDVLRTGKPTLVAFISCDCQIAPIKDEINRMTEKTPNISLVTTDAPNKLSGIQRDYQLNYHIITMRRTEMLTVLQDHQLPLLVDVASDGTISKVTSLR